MFLTVRLCAEPRLSYADLRSHFKVTRFTLQFMLSLYLLNPSNDFHSTSLTLKCFCTEFVTHILQTQSQGHTSRSWDSVMGDKAVLQTAVMFMFSFVLI